MMSLKNLLNHVWRKPEQKVLVKRRTKSWTGSDRKPGIENLSDYHVLRSEDYSCDKCTIENEYCKKLHFSNCTICVTPKDKINIFSVPKRQPVRKSNKL